MSDIAVAPDGEQIDWLVCRGCRALIYRRRFADTQSVCPNCAHHGRLPARTRLELLFDPGSFQSLGGRPQLFDPLEFVDTLPYRDRLIEARERTGLTEAVACAQGAIEGHPVVAAAMDFDFLGGSLGSATGE